MQQKGAAFRKRTQIASANKMMFLWVAGVSVVFGVCLVGAIFLGQMLFFNERVLHEKDLTVSTLDSNLNTVSALESNIRVLDTNQALNDSKAKPGDDALQVILDALPSDANSLALGASLQNKLLANISGLTLNSLQVDPVVGIETQDSTDSGIVSAGENQISFTFSVTGNTTSLSKVLKNLESSIRTIDIVSLKIENQGSSQTMTVQGRAYYEPAKKVELQDKVVK